MARKIKKNPQDYKNEELVNALVNEASKGRIIPTKREQSLTNEVLRRLKAWDDEIPKYRAYRHHKDTPDGIPCSYGKPVDDPIHIPRIGEVP